MIAIFPELSSCAKSGNVERLAILARSYFGGEVGRKPTADLKSIFEVSGVQLQPMKMDAYGAIAVNDENGRFRILAVYKEGMPEEEERFVLAHMLGHILLDIQPAITEGQVGKLGYKEEHSPLDRYSGQLDASNIMSTHQYTKETAADQFAAALLMPEGMVRRAAEKISQVEVLAGFFGVGTSVLEKRLIDLDLITGEPNSFLDGEKKLKGRIEDSPRPAEQPLNLNQLKSPTLQSRKTKKPQELPYGGSESHATNESLSTQEDEGTQTKKATAKTSKKKSRRAASASKKKKTRKTAKSSDEKEGNSGAGMARLRELAKMLDSSVE